eukprot:6214284-Pleurochrysis_carterae.AAC.5
MLGQRSEGAWRYGLIFEMKCLPKRTDERAEHGVKGASSQTRFAPKMLGAANTGAMEVAQMNQRESKVARIKSGANLKWHEFKVAHIQSGANPKWHEA